MKKVRPPLIAALLVLGGRACMAQAKIAPDVIASAGTCYVNSTASLSWTLGEPLSETDVSSTNFLTQGFHQPTSIIVTNVTSPNSNTGNLSAYPNPFSSAVNLQNNDEGKTLQVELVDMDGKTLFKKTMTETQEQFDLSTYSNGVYFLRVYNADNQLIQTLKIDKIK
ncbi:MAG: T9SS type A sorting domain-containing protein [Bacteroidia bacterium]